MHYRTTTVIIATLLVTAACERGPHGLVPTEPTGTTEAAITASPGISGVSVSNLAASTATIVWATESPSDSSVEYGQTERYGSTGSGDPSKVTAHSVTIGNLSAGTLYQFRVKSKDEAGSEAASANYTFTTLTQAAAPGGDTGNPVDGSPQPTGSIAIASPGADATVSGSTTVTATVHDAEVAGVQFKLDGADLGAEDKRAPYSVKWSTTDVGDGRHTLTAVLRTTAGASTSSADVRVTVKNSSGSAPSPSAPTEPPPPSAPAPAAPPSSGSNSNWPGEPDNFRVLSDQSWSSLTSNGWNYRRRQASKDADIFSDSSAPDSPSSVLRMIFTTDMDRDSEPGVHWMGLPSRPREIFTGWWMKLSPNWKASPAGGGKIAFLWSTNGQGQVYANIGGSGAPHRININTEWGPYGQKFWEPNVKTTSINYNQWYRVEWYVRWESSPDAGDGIIRWWVNGALNGDHRNVQFPSISGFEQFEFAPTLQNPPPAEQYMYIDHTYVSAK